MAGKKKKKLKPAKPVSKKTKVPKAKVPAKPVPAEKDASKKKISKKTGESTDRFLAKVDDPEQRNRRISDVTESASDEATMDKTPMRIYLQQIEKIPLLTPDEEISLAKAISEGGTKGEEARVRMIRSNLRLVISIAKRYANIGLPFSDLVEEGNIGLMRAVDKFNYKKGYRFSTYASWWIKQGVMRALSNQGKTIRVPVYMFDMISRWRKIREALIQKMSRIPTRKELSDALGIPVQKVKEIEQIASQPSSLNAPVSLDGQSEMMDLIQDEAASAPSLNIEDLFETERIGQLLGLLDERERQILILRFGLKGNEPHTLEETAKQFDVTRERVRQIEVAAIEKIRVALRERNQKMEDYVR